MKMKKQNDPNRVKLHFNKKRLYIAIAFFALGVLLVASLSYIPLTAKYPRQLLGFASIVSFVLGFVFIAKLFDREIRRELYRRVGTIFSSVSMRFRKIVDKIYEKLGIGRTTRKQRRDERSIVFEEENVGRRHRRKVKQKKYSDLTTNKERLRFLWAKFILDKKTKNNTPAVYDTPVEMMRRYCDLSGDHEQALYHGYLNARYTNPESDISPEIVNSNYKFVAGDKKI